MISQLENLQKAVSHKPIDFDQTMPCALQKNIQIKTEYCVVFLTEILLQQQQQFLYFSPINIFLSSFTRVGGVKMSRLKLYFCVLLRAG